MLDQLRQCFTVSKKLTILMTMFFVIETKLTVDKKADLDEKDLSGWYDVEGAIAGDSYEAKASLVKLPTPYTYGVTWVLTSGGGGRGVLVKDPNTATWVMHWSMDKEGVSIRCLTFFTLGKDKQFDGKWLTVPGSAVWGSETMKFSAPHKKPTGKDF